MSLRFQATGITIPTTNGAVAHGLGTTPQEWAFNTRAASANVPFLSGVGVDGTNIYVAVGTAAVSGDVFCSVNHSICR